MAFFNYLWGKGRKIEEGGPMTDKEILDWIEDHPCEIRYREFLPSGIRTEKVWWIAMEGNNPITGKTFREAISRCKREDK